MGKMVLIPVGGGCKSTTLNLRLVT